LQTPTSTTPPAGTQSDKDRLIDLINTVVSPLGYEVVTVEIQSGRQNHLRVFIDRLDGAEGGVSIEDCVRVTRALDEPLDGAPETDALFRGGWELEVSSPGVDRPLRQPKDYSRFAGREVRLHVYRPLTAEELGNPEYQTKNPRQKNFLGLLKGLSGEKIRLELVPDPAQAGGKKAKKKSAAKPARAEEILIPLALVSKANLEPDFSGLEANSKSEE
jgi:ribosome maturation factor RimP